MLTTTISSSGRESDLVTMVRECWPLMVRVVDLFIQMEEIREEEELVKDIAELCRRFLTRFKSETTKRSS